MTVWLPPDGRLRGRAYIYPFTPSRLFTYRLTAFRPLRPCRKQSRRPRGVFIRAPCRSAGAAGFLPTLLGFGMYRVRHATCVVSWAADSRIWPIDGMHCRTPATCPSNGNAHAPRLIHFSMTRWRTSLNSKSLAWVNTPSSKRARYLANAPDRLQQARRGNQLQVEKT